MLILGILLLLTVVGFIAAVSLERLCDNRDYGMLRSVYRESASVSRTIWIGAGVTLVVLLVMLPAVRAFERQQFHKDKATLEVLRSAEGRGFIHSLVSFNKTIELARGTNDRIESAKYYNDSMWDIWYIDEYAELEPFLWKEQ